MLSRTSARQQRMRQQILNEERMSQTPHLVRIPGQRKSSGSKLIISSPTPSTQPPGSISQPTSQSPPISTPNARISSQAPSRGPGASALLAFLSGPNQRSTATTAVTATNNTSPGDTESRSNHEPSIQRTGCALPTPTQAPSNLVDSSQTPKYIAAADAGKSVSCQYQTAQRPPGLSVQLSSSLGKPTSVNEGPVAPAVAERDSMEMDANLSSVSSDLNSPMESCFANILEEHGNDSIDLNSITPSIQFSTPVGSEFLNYARQHTSTNDRVHQVPCTAGQLQLGIRILQDYDTRQISPKLSEGSSPIKSSASCPTDVQGVLNPLGTSPLPVGSLGTQVGTSGSGGSLGGVSGTDGGSGSGTALLFTTVSPMSRHPEEQRAAWVRDRTKKDSHNRIERKRRDYINCQISELGNLLPEEMFRDGDCKKNKGSILKNSVEFICLLRAELSQLSEVRRETNLAAKVIGQLIKRIQVLIASSCLVRSDWWAKHNLQVDHEKCIQKLADGCAKNVRDSRSDGYISDPRNGSFVKNGTMSKQLAHVYSFEREEFIPQMKTEPPSDPDSQTGELNFTDSGPPTLDISTSQFEALVASVSPPSSSSRLAAATLSMQNPLHQNVDSPTNASFDTDDFRFDDVPMEYLLSCKLLSICDSIGINTGVIFMV
ncbi:Helix-loop-helix DNA-binding domain protein [Opisthorchis viverrini]|uniref:Helix-loop-helix DNA-binding domain protein n=1 Tax=Opisthorchis viverrini TaxID=6198 RepID=A0A1S8X463_OPIVI|nr:Helix-loop-helix DNA-binding domain protein [Opisthorchis viverrini]